MSVGPGVPIDLVSQAAAPDRALHDLSSITIVRRSAPQGPGSRLAAPTRTRPCRAIEDKTFCPLPIIPRESQWTLVVSPSGLAIVPGNAIFRGKTGDL